MIFFPVAGLIILLIAFTLIVREMSAHERRN